MPQETPDEFRMKDLFIDVKLEACVDGSSYDFLGRKLFSTEFFRKDVGFGITNIDIEVNTSLQPLVSITFKDLYGSTIFGGQNRQPTDDKQSIDYSVLFNWPPPKFLFSFKGYLGKPASWVLNLKRTSTSFNASDGSYDLKCEFVPNQWGFFADLPFLYLLAAKRLRKDAIGSLEGLSKKDKLRRQKEITSVFDLIKIGKQVEVKTQDTTKEFDDLVKQLGSIKSNVTRAASVSSIIKYGDEIDGVVNNRPIKGFRKIKIPALQDVLYYNTNELVEQNLGNATELSKMNTILLLSLSFENKPGSGIFIPAHTMFNVSNITIAKKNPNDPAITSAKNQTLELITKNLELIEDEIKRLVFDSSEKKLEKITIGEIFSQIGKDAALIIGSILDAGLDGYRGSAPRQALRDSVSDNLIGQAFPMIINEDGEEVPATEENLKGTTIGVDNLGVDAHEMDFVRRFIQAISEGIARDLISNSSGAGDDNSKLVQRVNNIEMASGNPYRPYYTNIATNILVRGGIVGYMTRSDDPNLPGEYGKVGFNHFDRDSRQEIADIAARDVQNISKSLLSQLPDTDALLLKRFCTFITRYYEPKGEYIVDEEGEYVRLFSSGIIDANYPVVMSINAKNEKKTLDFLTIWNELRQPSLLEGVDISDGQLVWDGVELTGSTPSNSPEHEQPADVGLKNAQNPLSFVDKDYTATRIMNNGLAYFFPSYSQGENKFLGVFFRGNANEIAQEANSAPTDSEFKGKDKDAKDSGQNEPFGYIPINAIRDAKNNVAGRVKTMIKYRDKTIKDKSLMYDQELLGNPGPGYYGAVVKDEDGQKSEDVGGPNALMFDNRVVVDKFAADKFLANPEDFDEAGIDFAGNVGFTVASHQNVNKQGALIFGFFEAAGISNVEGRNQRIFVRAFCAELLKDIEKLEDEKNQIIGSVLGKAGEQEATIYKQMHTLYHQWQSLSYSSEKIKGGSLCGDSGEFKNGEGGDDGKVFGVAEALERKYGDNHSNMQNNEMVTITNEYGEQETLSLTNPMESNGVPDGTFIYDYPLQRIRPVGEPVQVRDSIINLEPLYKANGNTTVLNIIQQVCTKNNFLFVPIPGNPDYLNVKSIYTPSPEPANIDIKNFFHVLFTPTPESRSKTRNSDGTHLALSKNQETYNTNSFVIKYGHPDNQIVSNISVGTDDTKVTAESIVNLQRLVDNENQNKKVTTDCSMLPVLAGRSYKASVDMLGNAQVYPMQFFYLKNSPLFGGLYQVMKVKHNISPNDFKTSVDGIRMRFSPGDGYGSIKPITLQTFRDLGALEATMVVQGGFDDVAREAMKNITSIVVEGTNEPVGDYTKNKIEKAVKGKGHKWFDTKGDYELNIVGVRNMSVGTAVTNKFDDFITLSYKENGEWKFWSWNATTQPGDDYILNPSRDEGTAILKPGQYINSHGIRKHSGSYDALGQNGKLTVYRDNNKDLNYDLLESTLQTGYFGINIHRSSSTGTSVNVNNWSAGCQVFANFKDFEQFMQIARAAKSKHGNKFTYTLLNSTDIPG